MNPSDDFDTHLWRPGRRDLPGTGSNPADVKRILAASLFLLVLAVPVNAEGGRAFTLDELLGLKSPHALTLSPTGDRVAFTVTTADFETGHWRSLLWMAYADGRPAVQLTRGHADDDTPRFSPDGRRLAFVSHRKEPDEDIAAAQIWILPLAGGEPFRATSLRGDLLDYEWAGESLVIAEREPLPPSRAAEAREREKRLGESHVEGEGLRSCSISVLDVETGHARTLVAGDPGIADIQVSRDGKRVAFASNGSGREDSDYAYNLFVTELSGGTPRAVTHFRTARPPRRSYSVDGFRGAMLPQWSPDGRSLACLQHVDPGIDFSRADVHVIPMGGSLAGNLTGASDRFVESYRWKGSTLLFVAADGTSKRIYAVDPPHVTPRILTKGDGVWDHLALSEDGRTAAAVFENATHGPEVYLFDVAHPEQAKAITRLNEAVREWRLATEEVIRWKSDGWTVEGVVVKPPGFDARKKYPLVVLPHGGPLGHTPLRLRHHLALQWLAQKGYAIFAPNFRGSDGYGNAFAVASRRDLVGGDYRDVMRGVDAVIAQGWVDTARLGVMGGSYGGYMTNWIISHCDRFKAAVSMYGIFSLITDFSNSTLPSFESDYLGDYYWEDPELYARLSPSRFVTQIHTPVLILHGEADTNTDIANSREMYTALLKLGRPAKLVTYPREEHGIEGEPNHARDVVLRIAGWLDEHLGRPHAAPPGWRARVVSAHAVEEYHGIRANGGRFVEVTLSLEAPAGSIPALTLPLDGVRLVVASGASYAPVGVPQEAAGGAVLLRGRDLAVQCPAAPVSASQAVPITVVFDVPVAETHFTVRVGDRPGIAIEIL